MDFSDRECIPTRRNHILLHMSAGRTVIHTPRIKLLTLFGGIGAPEKALLNLGVPTKLLDYVEIDESQYEHIMLSTPISISKSLSL